MAFRSGSTWTVLLARQRGRPDAAQTYYEQALPILREVQNRRGEGLVLFQLAQIAAAHNEFDRAETLHRESLAIAREIEHTRDIADSLQVLGELLLEQRPGTREEEGVRCSGRRCSSIPSWEPRTRRSERGRPSSA